MTWIAIAALAMLVTVPAWADDRQTSEDQGQSQSAGSQTDSGDTQQNEKGVAPDENNSGTTNSDGGGSQQAAPAPTLKELLASGYEVKSTVLVPRDVVKRGGASDAVDAMIITLQNGAALAICYEEFGSFVNDPTTLGCNEYK
jgi:hypothetical protein